MHRRLAVALALALALLVLSCRGRDRCSGERACASDEVCTIEGFCVGPRGPFDGGGAADAGVRPDDAGAHDAGGADAGAIADPDAGESDKDGGGEPRDAGFVEDAGPELAERLCPAGIDEGACGVQSSCFHADRVYVQASLDASVCSLDVIAPLHDPDAYAVGLPCSARALTVRDVDGALLVREQRATGEHVLAVFVADPHAAGGACVYPDDPAANDPVLPTHGCEGIGAPQDVQVVPTTYRYFYSCGASYWLDDEHVRVETAGLRVLGATADRTLLLGRSWSDELRVRRPDGQVLVVTGIPSTHADVGPVRSFAHRFVLMAYDQTGAGFDARLYQIDPATAAATEIGAYVPEATVGFAFAQGVLGAAGEVLAYGPLPGGVLEGVYRLAPGADAPEIVVREDEIGLDLEPGDPIVVGP